MMHTIHTYSEVASEMIRTWAKETLPVGRVSVVNNFELLSRATIVRSKLVHRRRVPPAHGRHRRHYLPRRKYGPVRIRLSPSQRAKLTNIRVAYQGHHVVRRYHQRCHEIAAANFATIDPPQYTIMVADDVSMILVLMEFGEMLADYSDWD
jgi:hypothetical protein